MESFEKTKQSKDYSISCARLIAMVFIVACHMMQRDDFALDIKGAHIGLAVWFNVGVQMFLFISGYLYGKKNRIDIVEFYKKSFPKLLIDYYVFIFVMLVVIHYSPLVDVDYNVVIGALTFSGTIPGLEHLWFIPTILFCYLLAPVFSEIFNAIDKKSDVRFWIESILLLVLIHIIIRRLFGSFNAAWINCFVLGMIYSRLERKPDANKRIFSCVVSLFCLLIVPLQFRIDYWPHDQLPSFFANRYEYIRCYGHVFLGILVIILIRFIYNQINHKSLNHMVLEWSDKYSYDVYIVHHVFVQSAFGCVEFISNRWIALPLAITLTILSSILLYYVSGFIRSKSIEMYRKLPN